jgi:8-amino-7-oxononanoate synthase
LIRRFRREAGALGYSLMPSQTPIQPLLIGDAGVAMAMSRALEKRGLWITAIRPPTVPAGEARLRVTFSASHTEADLDQLLGALAQCRDYLPDSVA